MINSFNSNENLTSPKKIEEDQTNDNSLRPQSFNDFVGQSDIIDNLKVYIEAAKKEVMRLIMFCFLGHLDLAKQRLQILFQKS